MKTKDGRLVVLEVESTEDDSVIVLRVKDFDPELYFDDFPEGTGCTITVRFMAEEEFDALPEYE